MTKNLVIAEKKSAALDMANALNIDFKESDEKKGYLEGNDDIVTWAQGHLLNIAPVEKQGDYSKKWIMEELPIFPKKLKLEVLKTSEWQFKIIEKLTQRNDIGEIICATDAGREGILIFKRIYDYLKLNIPYSHLWPEDLTEASLKKAFKNLLPAEDKINVARAANARSEADYVHGISYTRCCSIKTGETTSIGRVQTPVLAFIVHRFNEIQNFKSEKFYTIDSLFLSGGDEPFTCHWYGDPYGKGDDRLKEKAEAEAVRLACEKQLGTVIVVDKKDSKVNPPKLFDLILLQKEANKKYGFTADKTLKLAQELYSGKKVLTYPRTDSCYLSDELYNQVEIHMESAAAHFESLAEKAISRITEEKGRGKKFTCVNSKKVTDHHAIIPTSQIADKAELSADEWKIYGMVVRRFIAAFLPPALLKKTTVWIEIEINRFKTNGTIFEETGWMEAEPDQIGNDTILPDLEEGQTVAVTEITVKDGKTTPPPNYNDRSLLGAMETAGKEVEDEEVAEAIKEKGLGTPATRSGIIDTLLNRGYIERKGKHIIATPKGCGVIQNVESLLPVLASPELTGEWEFKLKQIESGEYDYESFMNEIHEQLKAGIGEMKEAEFAYTAQKPEKKEVESLGVCPACGGKIYDKGKAYGCDQWKEKGCQFTIWKTTAGAKVSVTAVKQLLKDGITKKKLKMKSKAKKAFETKLKLDDSHKVIFDFS